ncbi:MAG: F0F1 ATP synthase subunit delta, partial [Deltaproteobacteria bacterium]
MKKFAIARRYAKALFIIGKKDGNFEKYLNELLTLNEVIEKEKKLWEILVNPLFEFDIRKKILKE